MSDLDYLSNLKPSVGDVVEVEGGPRFRIDRVVNQSYFTDDLVAPLLSPQHRFRIIKRANEIMNAKPIQDQSSQPKGGWWIHKKTGHRYEIVTFALIEATLEPSVVYRSEKGQVWVRPAEQFFDGRFQQTL